jgi:predicted AAA+ superfamily ATPase
MYPRFAEALVRAALRDTRIVAISGPRQSGKTTLARRFAQRDRVFLTLDNQPTLEAAKSDPVSFIRGLDRAVIDEVQRAPELLLAIKQSVDEEPRPGRFLLTGSANLLTIRTVHESLAGRVEIIPLYPLGRSEWLRSNKPRFLSQIFRGMLPRAAESLVDRDLLRLVTAGGYPDAIKRRTERRRQDWYRAYLDSLVVRDIPDVASVDGGGQFPRLLEICARFAGQLTNLSEIGRAIGRDHKTVGQYLRILEQIYLVQAVLPWSRNELSRLVKSPKLHFIDSGLLCALRGHSSARLRSDRTLLGPLLETFVFSELLKAAGWAGERVSIFHYRDKDQLEVDFVLENSAGEIVGIEVKAAASVMRRDFAGLERVASAAGPAFVQGLVLYDGEQTLSFGSNLHAVPLATLWA